MGEPEMVVAVCGGCGTRAREVLDALAPVVRDEPGAVLLRTTCLGDCPGGTRVVVQPWRGGRACRLDAHDAAAAARTVRGWLRAARFGGFRRRVS